MANDGHASIVEALLGHAEPSVRWKVRTQVVDADPHSAEIVELRDEIRRSDRVRRLLAPCLAADPPSVYAKWQGAHWVLAALADLGYPAGDAALPPLRERVLATWLADSYYAEFGATTKSSVYRREGVPVMEGRYRQHGSQQGNALWFLVTLGLADERCDALAERLLHWQWPDGGWNCDKNPSADTSSFMETLLPMRGLATLSTLPAHPAPPGGPRGGPDPAGAAARRAADVFLTRRLAYRTGTRQLIRPEFGKLHYPLYWHYDILGGLKAMAQLGLLADDRCADALDLLESLRVADGWPAHASYHKVSDTIALHNDSVDWGGTSVRRANPWVTADALAVLRAAGRLQV
jgi:hypothetical protein